MRRVPVASVCSLSRAVTGADALRTLGLLLTVPCVLRACPYRAVSLQLQSAITKLELELSPPITEDAAAVNRFRMLAASSPRSGGGGTGSRAPAGGCGPAWSNYDLGNVSLVCALATLIGLMYIANPVHHRFIINAQDPAINYPLMAQTVPAWLLGLLVFWLPVCAILGIYWLQRHLAQAKRELYYVMFGLVYSLLLTLLFTEFMKRITGRPRPNFIAMSGYQSDGSFTGTDAQISQAFQSYPSGHTSTSFAGLGYLGLYLFRLCFPEHGQSSRDSAARWHTNQGYKTVVCLLPFFLATWIGLTRIVDYWHNFDDVSFGALLGLSIATLTFQLHCNWWWLSLHGPNDSPLNDVPNGAAGGGGGASGSSSPNANARRHSGPSDGPTSGSDVVSPLSGRRAFARDKDEYPEAPLLDNIV